jgi:hypothetical protein
VTGKRAATTVAANTFMERGIMSTLTAVETGLYLYGIIDARDGLDVAARGIDGGRIETIEADGVAAVITRVSRQTIRPQRANLAAHNNLLRSLVNHQTVIPCAFGMVASGEEQLRDVLRANHDKLVDLLSRLRGKVEMSLSVYWNTSNIFEFFVGTNHDLKQMRDRLFRPDREPSLEEKLELGRTFEALLQQCRERHTQQVIDTLSPYCAEIRAVDPGSEQMIMKLVCLVPKDQEDRFEVGIQEAARRFDDHYNFKYNGPWAPFDFVDVALDLS